MVTAGVLMAPLLGAVAPAAQAAEAPPYLHPCLDTRKELPTFVYRGVALNVGSPNDDNQLTPGAAVPNMDPDSIYRDGFTSKGNRAGANPSFDLNTHVIGDTNTGHSTDRSGYVSTSGDLEKAKEFGAGYGGFTRVDPESAAGQPKGWKEGWVYKIRPDRRFLYIPDQFFPGDLPGTATNEKEWAAVGAIPGGFVESAMRVRQAYIRLGGQIVRSGPIEVTEERHREIPVPDRVLLPPLEQYHWSSRVWAAEAPTMANENECLGGPADEDPECKKPDATTSSTAATLRSAALRSTATTVAAAGAAPKVSTAALTASADAPVTAPVTTPAATDAGRARPFDGATYQLTAAASAYGPTFNLDVRGGVKADGTVVQAYARNCTASQNWRLREVANGRYVVESVLAQGTVLQQDADSHNTVIRPVQNDAAGRPNGSTGQQWTFKDAGDGTFNLVSAADQSCLTMAGQQSAGLSVRPCDGGIPQKWKLAAPCVPADPGTPSGAGRTVPGYQGLPWPTVKGHPELTWPALPGAPGIPWPSVPGYPDVPMPGRPDLPAVDWPGAPQLPAVRPPTHPGRTRGPAVARVPGVGGAPIA
ncbi:RICIN domain-containing protein, partial [Kitasatospora sp. NPDC059722]|uniref:RICIN domain-containing protein n=1 Tax=Kitasatospora sp. NPDC059722 TaxID=3346925 RepID=UPI0036CD7B27